jgi:hypothetical protein
LKEAPESQGTDPPGKREKEAALTSDSVRSHLLPEVVVTEKHKFKREDLGIHYADIIYDVVSEVDKIIDGNESYTESIEDFLVRTNPYFSLVDMNKYGVPDVKTNRTGKVSIQFYNNNSYTKVDVSAEGITKNGHPFVFEIGN